MSAAIREIAASASRKAVRLKILPRPWNISESRAVLKVLQRYGDVVFFRHLQHETPKPAHNTVVAIFRDYASVDRLMQAQPIRYSLDPTLPHSRTKQISIPGMDHEGEFKLEDFADDESASSTTEDPKLPPEAEQETPFPHQPPIHKVIHPGTGLRDFVMWAEPSTINTQDWAERQPYWNSYDSTEDYAQQDLKKSVPLKGMADLSFKHTKLLDYRIRETNFIRDSRLTLRRLWEGEKVHKENHPTANHGAKNGPRLSRKPRGLPDHVSRPLDEGRSG
ncbi:hypothetical protein EJ05DRAFT_500302 [Pseudovirgaria hyperparasitica]|uniref:Uncharacterized protein n=1 Tax=Pseudovirgaria hyperparasitica TaxID=470096 RepID=A0A6A6W813_9PEZI|nr:uncharacterized protein EJ05DRAFT_500302 [Pseudovirgaria hyperparasitica]KAF2758783.1 hypothetical protein EJ05DRAFT_500302 [Pseudovirgaria hyperparasitica]